MKKFPTYYLRDVFQHRAITTDPRFPKYCLLPPLLGGSGVLFERCYVPVCVLGRPRGSNAVQDRLEH